jgi:hypothetical protein
MRLFALLIAASATPPAAVDTFDMACAGSRIVRQDGPATPHAFRLRIDLAAGRWCVDGCESVRELTAATVDRITLRDSLILNAREESTADVYVDRKTNEFHQLEIATRPAETYLKIDARCRIEPSTPFPAPKD